MTVTSVVTEHAARTLTLTAEYAATPDRVWQLWSDPRRLERWWGPPTYPATVVDHDLTPGGRVRYYMTGPAGDRHWGWWQILLVEAPRLLEFEDGFADDAGNPDPDMPTTATRVEITATSEGTTIMTIVGTFPSAEAMEQVVAMGVVEGLTAAVGQTDDILREEPAA